MVCKCHTAECSAVRVAHLYSLGLSRSPRCAEREISGDVLLYNGVVDVLYLYGIVGRLVFGKRVTFSPTSPANSRWPCAILRLHTFFHGVAFTVPRDTLLPGSIKVAVDLLRIGCKRSHTQ